MMQTEKQRLAALLAPELCAAGVKEAELAAALDYPKNPAMGDLALACFPFAKALKKAPQQIAQALMQSVVASAPGAFAKVEAVGGYLNFTLSDAAKINALCALCAAGEDYGKSAQGKDRTVVLDFSSPNIAKPFHIGHLGTTAIGNCLQRLHRFSGYRTVSINHLGDWGTQFGRLIVAYRRFGNREAIEEGGVDALSELYRLFYEKAEKDPSMDDEARAVFAALEGGDPELLALWQWFKDLSLAEFKRTYALLGLDFDSWAGESFYNDKMPAVISELTDKGLLTESDGAMVVDLSAYDMPPCLILKSDGSTLYATRDITAALYRKKTYDFDRCIYVTDAGQSLHFKQWFTVVGMMGYDWYKDLVHIPYGKLSINGVKLASRAGNAVLLRDLFADAIERAARITEQRNPDCANKEAVAVAVGVGAVVFHQLSSARIKDVSFVPEEALNFDGDTGPYVQYTHARVCSVLRKAPAFADLEAGALSLCAEEAQLFTTLSRFPEAVQKALAEYEPGVIAHFALDLCQSFNRFYQACPVLKTTGGTLQLRLRFCAAVRAVLKNCLWLLGMEAPETI